MISYGLLKIWLSLFFIVIIVLYSQHLGCRLAKVELSTFTISPLSVFIWGITSLQNKNTMPWLTLSKVVITYM